MICRLAYWSILCCISSFKCVLEIFECLSPSSTTPFDAAQISPTMLLMTQRNVRVCGKLWAHEILQISYIDAKHSTPLQKAFGTGMPGHVDRFKDSILLLGRKVTGDCHVRASEVTWFADISNDNNALHHLAWTGDIGLAFIQVTVVDRRLSTATTGTKTVLFSMRFTYGVLGIDCKTSVCGDG